MGLYGQNDDEDEKFKQMLSGIIGSGPAPYDVTTPLEQPDASSLSVPTMPGSTPGLGGYTPPPAASAPQYLDHVEGHRFGAGDVAMLGGILAALLGGGRHRGEIAGSLAGQYGGAVMQNNARADARNQQIDQYNSQLAAKDDPLERWKADQTAQYQAGNLKARADDLKLQQEREDRIAAHEAGEDAKDPIEQARLIEEARQNARLDAKRKENDMDVGTREMLGEILGKQRQKYAAPTGGGTGPDGKPLDPVKLLKQKQAQALLDGINDGTIDPTTGKPIVKPGTKVPDSELKVDDYGNLPINPATGKQFTEAEWGRRQERQAGSVPIPGFKIDNEEAFKAATPTAGERGKVEKYARGLQQVRNSLQVLQDIRKSAGTEFFDGGDKSEYDAALTAAIGGFTQIGESGVLNGGEFARYKDFIPGIGPKASDLRRLNPFGDGKDPTLEQLKGVQAAVDRLGNDGLSTVGLSFDGNAKGRDRDAPQNERQLGKPTDSGITFSVDTGKADAFNAGGGAPTGKPGVDTPAPTDGGKKLVQLVSPSGKRGSRELSDDELNGLLSAGWKVAQ